MALFISQDALTRQTTDSQVNRKSKNLHSVLLMGACLGMLSLSACQTAPTSMKPSSTKTSPSISSQKSPAIAQNPSTNQSGYDSNKSRENSKTDDPYPVEPYQPPVSIESPAATVIERPIITTQPRQNESQTPIATQTDIIILAPAREDDMVYEPSIPSHNELLERARQNSQQSSQKSNTNNSNLPAFRNLMQVGTEQLKAGNLNAAESSFTRAQRLAPKSSAVYFYLAQVALKKNQPRKAEAMARRGLTVAQDSNRRRALWQIILQSGQQQGNARVIKEAKQALR